jgi:dihydroxy-acid dehydratase
MDTEEMIRAQPLDGVVLLVNCDKTIPAALMGAASADLPAILLSGGPMLSGHYQGEILGACTDCRRLTAEYQAGVLDAASYQEIEDGIVRSIGHCMVMGTASTMNSLAEALGIALPGNGSIPAPDSRRLRLGVAAGRRIVELAREGVRPSQIMTRQAFENAITLLCALGGSTNAVVHLPAIAGRLGIELPLELFDEISRRSPMITNMRPAGQYQMEDLFYAGGISAVLSQLLPLLHGELLTVTGHSLADNVEGAQTHNSDVIRTLDDPLQSEGGLAILRGNLAPDGAVIKHPAATARLLQHRGRAVVFRDMDDLRARINSPDLDVVEDDVLVLQNVGPAWCASPTRG